MLKENINTFKAKALVKQFAKVFLFAVIILGSLFLNGCFSSPEGSLYYDSGYLIEDYAVNIDVSEENILSVTEILQIKYIDPSRGFNRYFPTVQNATTILEDGTKKSSAYRIGYSDVKLEASTNASYIVEFFEESGFLIVGIERSGARFTGEVSYRLSYKMDLGDDRNLNEDSFYFNVIGNGWDTNIDRAAFTINFPKEIKNEVWCYPDNGNNFKIEPTNGGKTISGEILGLKFGEGVTIRTVFEEGYFKSRKSYLWDVIIFIAILAATIIGVWLIFKNRKKSPLIEVVEFDSPDGLTPTEVGFLIDGTVNDKDVTAMIVYWANKGLLNITEADEENVVLTKLKEADDNIARHEKLIYKALFQKGEKVKIKSLGLDFATAAGDAKTMVKVDSGKKFYNSGIRGKRYLIPFFLTLCLICAAIKVGYESVSLITVILGILGGVISFIGASVWLSGANNQYAMKKAKVLLWKIIGGLMILAGGLMAQIGIGAAGDLYFFDTYCDPLWLRIFTTTAFFAFAYLLPIVEIHSEYGKIMLGRVVGLRNFILVAEKDRIEMLVNDSPEAFFRVLPYAYVLGVSDTWIKKFEGINLKVPEWFVSGNANPMLAATLINASMRSVSKSMSVERARAMSSSSKGSSGGGFGGGGGFSGGGFGGGGGGRR